MERNVGVARDYYRILGIDRSATDQEIKRAYRKLAMKFHPDRNPDDELAAESFREVSVAYEVLSDSDKRRMVDSGRDPLDETQGSAAGYGDMFANMFGGDIFDSFFGGGGRSRGPMPRVRRGNDALIKLAISLGEAYTGVQESIEVDTAILCTDCGGSGSASGKAPITCPDCNGAGEIQQVQRSFLGNVLTSRPCARCGGTGEIIEDPCKRCGGDGRVRSRRDITVNIPSGVDDGVRVRLAGQGEVGPGGGPAGDLYVEIETTEDDIFHREQDDLHVNLNVPMAEAALGTKVKIDSLVGEEITIDIEPGTQPADVIRLRGQGMPKLRTDGHGDLLAHVTVTVPTKLDKKSRELLQQLADRSNETAGLTAKPEGGVFARLRRSFGR